MIFAQQARDKVDAYIALHPEYTTQDVEQPGQGSTNHVVFAKTKGKLVVFKVFCEIERKQRECFALDHWADTGLIPLHLVDAGSDMIVISHIPGHNLYNAHPVDPEYIWQESVFNTGRAIAELANVPLSPEKLNEFTSSFYQPFATLDAYLQRILDLGWRIHAKDPDFGDDYWGYNLEYIRRQLSVILSQPRILYHQDVSNFHVSAGRFMGFFDLEMCRVGCTALQLGASFPIIQGDKESWRWFRNGWEEVKQDKLTSKDLHAAAASNYLLGWREISRYLSYDGTPGTGYTWASPADPTEYRNHFISLGKMIGINPVHDGV